MSVVSAESSLNRLTATTSRERSFNHPWDFGRTLWAALLSRRLSIRMT